MHSFNSSVLSLGDVLSFIVKDFVSLCTTLLLGCHSNAFCMFCVCAASLILYDFLL